MLKISEASFEDIVFIINGCKLSTMFQPIKVAHIQELANQPLFNGALVIEMINSSFCERNRKFDMWQWKFGCVTKEKRSNKKWDIGSKNS